jgi:hypothetical protein
MGWFGHAIFSLWVAAPCFAAGSKIVLIAKVMVEMNKKLPLIHGSEGKMPLYCYMNT